MKHRAIIEKVESYILIKEKSSYLHAPIHTFDLEYPSLIISFLPYYFFLCLGLRRKNPKHTWGLQGQNLPGGNITQHYI